MGFRLRWLAVANATADEACDLLGFRRTKQFLPDPRYEMRDLPLGSALARHYLILEDGKEDPWLLRDQALAAASRRFELLTGFVYDVVSTTDAGLWRDGRLVWRLTFEGHEEDAKLVVHGDPPPNLGAWQQEAEDAYEVPLRASFELTGFQHDRDLATAFERLQRGGPQPGILGGLAARLFGRRG